MACVGGAGPGLDESPTPRGQALPLAGALVASEPRETVAGGTAGPVARQGVRHRVLILCGDADGNLGDRAIVQAICQTLREAEPEGAVALTVLCSNADRARRAYGAAALPTGWRGWLALWRSARSSSLVICGGGGLFQDDDSLVKMPYWAARVAVARLACPRVAGVSLGVGPLKAWVSRWFGRAALRRLEPVSVRDPLAQQLACELIGDRVELVPDPAMLLKPASDEQASAMLAAHGVPLDGRPLIGVAPRRWFPPKARILPHRLMWRWRGAGVQEQAANRDLAALLAQTLDRLAESCGGHVVFLPSYNSAHEADDQLCRAIAEQMRSTAHTLIQLDEPALYKAITAKLAVMLGGRMHPTIFAAGSGTPVVGLAYNPKFHGLFDLLGVEDHVIDVVDFVAHQRVDALVHTLATAMQGEPGLGMRANELGRQTQAFLQKLLRTSG
ncbi:MAG: polysaccharide pyruvyl transferase family protein [Phycisphaeraceae bacterium]